jgi:hypothetical protein
MASTDAFPTRLPLQLRRASIEKGKIDQEKRTVEFSFSSSTPIMRQFGLETLSHNPDSVDLSRLEDGGPVLDSHSWERQIGIVERARLRGGKGHACRLSITSCSSLADPTCVRSSAAA